MLKFGFIGLTNFSEALCVNLLKKVNAMAYRITSYNVCYTKLLRNTLLTLKV